MQHGTLGRTDDHRLDLHPRERLGADSARHALPQFLVGAAERWQGILRHDDALEPLYRIHPIPAGKERPPGCTVLAS